jgi:ABC-type dipeptide/oligopeptide/nickel transport system permease component
MGVYVIKRLLLMIPTFILISLLVFVILNMAPGRAGQLQLSGGQSESVRDASGAREGYLLFKLGYGLDRPLLFNTRLGLDYDDIERRVETIARNLTATVPGETEALAVGRTVSATLTAMATREREAVREALAEVRAEADDTSAAQDTREALEDRLTELAEFFASGTVDIRPPRPPAAELVRAFEDLEDWGMYAVSHLMRVANEHPSAKVRWQAVEFLTLNAQDRAIHTASGAVVARQPERLIQRVFETATPVALGTTLRLIPLPRLFLAPTMPVLDSTYRDMLRASLPRYDVRNWSYRLGAQGPEVEATMALWNAWFERNQYRFEHGFWDKVRIFFLDTRLAHYWGNLLRGDLGVSSQYRRPVTQIIFERWKYSIYLSLLSLLFAYFLSLPIGMYSAVKQGGLFDRGIGVLLFLLYSLPSFFVATLLSDYLSAAEAPSTVFAILRWSLRVILIGIVPFFIGAYYRSRALELRVRRPVAFRRGARAWALAVVSALAFTELLFRYGIWLLVFVLVIAWPLFATLRRFKRDRDAAARTGVEGAIPFPLPRLVGLMTAGVLVTVVLALLKDFFPGPVSGFSTEGALLRHTMWEHFLDVCRHLLFPVACLTYGSLAYLSRFARTGLLDVIRSDYIRTARAKGLSEPVVIMKHAVRNGMIPILTLLATALPALIGGSVVIEVIFGIPGLGQLIFSSVIQKDFTIVMGVLQISAVLTMFGILLSDLSYALVDPRITFD